MSLPSYSSSTTPTTPCTTCDCTNPQVTNSRNIAPAHSPVVVGLGCLMFNLPLLQSSAIGAGGFSFSLNYMNVDPGGTSVDATIGTGFNFTQNFLLAPSGDDVILFTPDNTNETFSYVGGGVYSSAANNTAATLTRSGAGTPPTNSPSSPAPATSASFMASTPPSPRRGVS